MRTQPLILALLLNATEATKLGQMNTKYVQAFAETSEPDAYDYHNLDGTALAQMSTEETKERGLTSPKDLGQWVQMPGHDLLGHDIKCTENQTALKCAAQCNDDKTCKSFIFGKTISDGRKDLCCIKNKNAWEGMNLKWHGEVDYYEAGNADQKNNLIDFTRMQSHDLMGHDISCVEKSTDEGCAKSCKADTTCQSFVFGPGKIPDGRTDLCCIKHKKAQDGKNLKWAAVGVDYYDFTPTKNLDGTQWTTVPQYDLMGHDLWCGYGTKELQCAEKCNDNDKCKSFIWAPTLNLCCIKHKDANEGKNLGYLHFVDYYEPTKLIPKSKDKGTWRGMPGYDLMGHDIACPQNHTVDSCTKLCNDTKNCKSFIFGEGTIPDGRKDLCCIKHKNAGEGKNLSWLKFVDYYEREDGLAAKPIA